VTPIPEATSLMANRNKSETLASGWSLPYRTRPPHTEAVLGLVYFFECIRLLGNF